MPNSAVQIALQTLNGTVNTRLRHAHVRGVPPGEINRNAVERQARQAVVSTLAPGFKSKNAEYRTAVNAVKDALTAHGVTRILWVLDRGFDALDFLRFL
ncbi:hypothetical protein, partial [Deinococcus yavapaiensis]